MEICIQQITGSSANSLLTDDSTLWCGVYGGHLLAVYDLAGNKRRESINYEPKRQSAQVNVLRKRGNCVLLGCEDGVVRVVDPRENSVVQNVDVHSGVSDIRVIDHQDSLMLTSGHEGDVKIWDSRWMQHSLYTVSSGLKYGSAIEQVSLDRQGNHLFLAQSDGSIPILATNL